MIGLPRMIRLIRPRGDRHRFRVGWSLDFPVCRKASANRRRCPWRLRLKRQRPPKVFAYSSPDFDNLHLRSYTCRTNGVGISATDPVAAAKIAGLRYVTDRVAGIRRVGTGKTFRYFRPDGRPVRDP